MFDTAVPNLEDGQAWTVVSKLANYFSEREEIIRSNWNEAAMATITEDDDAEQPARSYKDTGVIVARATVGDSSLQLWGYLATG